MPNYTCATHKDNPNWRCFESNGGIHHIEGEIQKVDATKINVNAFIEAVRDDISIGIVEVDDSDFVQFGVIKQLAKTHLGWDENKSLTEEEKAIGINDEIERKSFWDWDETKRIKI